MKSMSYSSLNEPVPHAVKALIYRSDGQGQLLLQLRDYAPGFLYPGLWTFFGGRDYVSEILKQGN